MPRELVWDNEPAVGGWYRGRPRLGEEFEAFRGMLGMSVRQLRPRDPEAKGLVERGNDYYETSFLPGRTFTGPDDFNTQIERLDRPAGQPAAPPGVGLSTGRSLGG